MPQTQSRAIRGVLIGGVLFALVGVAWLFRGMTMDEAEVQAWSTMSSTERRAEEIARAVERRLAMQPSPTANSGGRTWSRRDRLDYFACHVAVPRGFEHSEVRMKMGDDAAWARPDYDDLAWQDATRLGVPQRAGIFWLRFRVRAAADGDTSERWLPDGISHRVNAAFDLFWDGHLLARSGVPGNRPRDETPGKVDTVFSLPEDWRGSGEHVVALRLSTHYSNFPGEWTDYNATFGPTRELLTQFYRAGYQPALASGAMFMVAALGFVLWLLADRRLALLLFVGLCLCSALTQWLALWRYFSPYTYDWHYPVRLAAVWLLAGFGGCLLMFVAMLFAVPHRWWLLGAYGAIVATILWLPRELYSQPIGHKAGWEVTGAFAMAFGCAGWAAWQRRRGAWIVAAGLLVSTVALRLRPGDFLTGSFLPTALPAMLGLLAAVALRVREERRQAEQAQLTAARLEVELLKKNLQPHFLMNTLTALTEVIEQNPGAATALIDDLATELRTLSRMSGEKQVSLAEEIELCRVHLRVMAVRTGVAWSLAADGVDENAPVPPAMFLTLIENAFVHQRTKEKAAVFRLRMEADEGAVRFTFFSPGELRPTQTARVSGGTGLRYVRARLEESFSRRWTFAHGAAPAGWETVIEVRAMADGGAGA